jgi:hypothetical protein
MPSGFKILKIVAVFLLVCLSNVFGETFPSGFTSVLDPAKIKSISDQFKHSKKDKDIDWREIKRLLFDTITDPSPADVICYIGDDDSIRIGLAKGSKHCWEFAVAKEEKNCWDRFRNLLWKGDLFDRKRIFGEQRVWVIVFSRKPFQNKNPQSTVISYKDYKSRDSTISHDTLSLNDTTITRAIRLLSASGSSGPSNVNTVPASFEIEVTRDILSYKPGPRESAIGKAIGSISNALTGKSIDVNKEEEKNQFLDSSRMVKMMKYGDSIDYLYYGMTSFPLSINTHNRISIKPKNNGKQDFHINKTFGNYDPSYINLSMGIGVSASPAYSPKDTSYPTNEVNLNLFGLFYLKRPIYLYSSEGSIIFLTSNWSIAAGTNLTHEPFTNFILGIRKGLWSDIGLIAGQDFRRNSKEKIPWRRVWFFALDKGLF